MGTIVNRGFESSSQPQEPIMGGQMQDYLQHDVQYDNPMAYSPPMEMQNDYQLPLSSIVNGAADDGYQFAQQSSMFRDAREMNQNGSPYGGDQEFISRLGDLLGGMGGQEGGNPIYQRPYGNRLSEISMGFPLPNDENEVYGPYRRHGNLGSVGDY